MFEISYDKINEYSAVTIKLASPKEVRDWSYGEVKKAETLNYRTHKPEKDGLFCEKIFGPKNDWECHCGKYKGSKHRGLVCEKCGVKVTRSRVRRKRMGHISLASPVAHIWFFKGTPRISTLLGIKNNLLEKVIYFQEYIVIDPGNTPLKKYDVIKESKYLELKKKYGEGSFRVGMGAEAIKELLETLDLDQLLKELQEEYEKCEKSKQKRKNIIKRLELVKKLKESGNKPEWMILEVVPVIPPDLRPLIVLETGSFATSDLNDLYRRLINRNNRLNKLINMNAPEVIIRNEKRMLQQSVDALFDNSRCKKPVMSGNRPLKSLSDLIKGKQGRFRENLLGKRVDYSGRSVIVVGPRLKLHQCGLPKKIALELYQPFIIRKLREKGYSDNIKSAKKLLKKRDEKVWDALEEVVKYHPVLLNRAPTLHRMGIQAFEPVLVEGNAIKIHPLVCTGFNADFDGDQMAVHLPLSIEAQVEAVTLMLSTNNIFSPAHGKPIIAPSQDIVLGSFYLTRAKDGEPGEGLMLDSFEEVFLAHFHKKVTYHTWIWFLVKNIEDVVPKPQENEVKGRYIKTTVGRVIFNSILPKGVPFYNLELAKKQLEKIIAECYKIAGKPATLKLLDDLKELGFYIATIGGISFSKDNLKIPKEKKEIVKKAAKEAEKYQRMYEEGKLTEEEKHNKIVDIWTQANKEVGKAMMKCLEKDKGADGRSFNPVYLMSKSGARGKEDQIRQLAGMRGLMAKPNGDIIEAPIISNFREGLKVLEYFSSTHGARKGLADTALKTADAGYLTRKLADVAQSVVVNEYDCGTMEGITKPIKRSIGRVSIETIKNRDTGEVIVKENELITEEIAKKMEALGYEKVRVRSPLTCDTPLGICAKCYGMDLSRGELVEEGMAVGIIAAQSIGEPGTQLTMRTFHIGGIAKKIAAEKTIKIVLKGRKVKVSFDSLNIYPDKENNYVVINEKGRIILLHEDIVKIPKGAVLKVFKDSYVVLDTPSEVVALIDDKKGNVIEIKAKMGGKVKEIEGEIDKDNKVISKECIIKIESKEIKDIPQGTKFLKIKKGNRYDIIKEGDVLTGKKGDVFEIAERDPHTRLIYADKEGYVRYEDIIPKVTYEDQGDKKVIKKHKGDKHPLLFIKNEKEEILSIKPLPEKAEIMVEDGEYVRPGILLAKIPRETSGTQDITGGLPRVTEIFEARHPKNKAAVICDIDGEVSEIKKDKRGKIVIVVKREGENKVKEFEVDPGKEIKVSIGDIVKAGDPLVEGIKAPQDILKACGPQKLQEHLLEEIQNVYREQGVEIDDKHIEIIIRQMMRKVKIEKPGDTDFLPGSKVDRFKLNEINRRIRKEGKKPASFKPLLLGITKAALESESFISAASFQETTKVLTEAAISAKRDELLGLKENVIVGHLIPAGTGFKKHIKGNVKVMGEESPKEKENKDISKVEEAPSQEKGKKEEEKKKKDSKSSQSKSKKSKRGRKKKKK